VQGINPGEQRYAPKRSSRASLKSSAGHPTGGGGKAQPSGVSAQSSRLSHCQWWAGSWADSRRSNTVARAYADWALARRVAEDIALAGVITFARTGDRDFLSSGSTMPVRAGTITAGPPIERWLNLGRGGSCARLEGTRYNVGVQHYRLSALGVLLSLIT